MSITQEHLEKVITRLASDESWQKISPEIQKSVLDDLHHEVAENILDGHINNVEKETKPKRKSRRRAKKEDSDGEVNPE